MVLIYQFTFRQRSPVAEHIHHLVEISVVLQNYRLSNVGCQCYGNISACKLFLFKVISNGTHNMRVTEPDLS